MKVEVAYAEGRKRVIYWLVLPNGDCPARKYLEELRRRDRISHQAMVRRYVNHANNGHTTIKKHGHPIAKRKNLFVWKTDQGARLLYFELPDKSPVMTWGYNKGAPENQQYDRAERHRDAFEGGNK
jgi:hypothetical protein